jgi:transcriptional regulator with XRE-family HTH domain
MESMCPAAHKPATRQGVRFIQVALSILNCSVYRLAEDTKVSRQNISNWLEGSPKQRDFLAFICRLRKLTGLSWAKLGKMLDDEFLDKEKP